MTDTGHARLAADWATILQSEAAALAVDREVQEAAQRLAGRLARQAMLLQPHPLHAWGAPADDPARPAGADAAPGTPAAVAPPHAAAAPVQPCRNPAGLG